MLHSHGGHSHGVNDGKAGAPFAPEQFRHHRFAFVSGARFTRYSTEDGKAHLWETGVGFDYEIFPSLHIGADLTYGWFDSKTGDADGLLSPHLHFDFHIPLARGWEIGLGVEVGLPGGEEALVGEHWELAPHLEVRYDAGAWFVDADAKLVFVFEEGDHHQHGGSDHHEHEAEEDESGPHEHAAEPHDEEHEEETHTDTHDHHLHAHEHPEDFHHLVEPHGESELQYSLAAGVRVFDRKLTLESRLAGVRVLAGETAAQNYVRGGFRASWALNERVLLIGEASMPVTDAERNQWQTSIAMRVSF
jgi:hypothetical protein